MSRRPSHGAKAPSAEAGAIGTPAHPVGPLFAMMAPPDADPEQKDRSACSGPDGRAEQAAREAGYTCVCGIDEAGRGPLAGPVVAAAVVLPPDFAPMGLNDSKKLTARRRERLFAALMADDRVQKSVAQASAAEIDRLNILRATHLAMARAAQGLAQRPDFCLIDGLPVPDFPFPSQSIVKGDARCLSIAAASILAKVTRDRLMAELDTRYPGYGFARHAGYGTAAHLEALRRLGPCPEHRRSFAPVAQAEQPGLFDGSAGRAPQEP